RDRPHKQHPAAIAARNNSIHLVERIVSIFLVPQFAGLRIERQAETVANAIIINLLDIRADGVVQRRAIIEERIVSRSAAVVVEAQYDSGEMRRVRLRPAELVVLHFRWASGRRAALQILEPPAPAVIANDNVKFAVRPE